MESQFSEKQREEAMRWVLRHEEGLSEKQMMEFEGWVSKHPDNETCFFEYQMDWTGLDAVRFWNPEMSATPNPDLFVKQPKQKKYFWYAATAIAACVIVSFVFLRNPAPPSITHPEPNVAQEQAYEGGKRHFLEDGSSLYLRKGSQISITYTKHSRNLYLSKGEAIFEVAKDSSRPFIVSTNTADVVAVGTIFSVNTSENFCEVYVTEGRVELKENSSNANDESNHSVVVAELDAGQKINIPVSVGAFAPRIQKFNYEEFAQKTNWANQIIDMVSAPLFEIIDEFNKYNEVHIYIPDEHLRSIRMSVSVTPDNQKEFLNLLEMTLNIRLERNDTGIYLLPQ